MTRGTLRIYLGCCPGVGKTYAMLGEGCRRAARGADVVVGLVETHGRELTGAALGPLEVVPRRRVRYRDTVLTELDTDAVLARAPRVVLVDELAHTNVPGSAYPKRWQDVRRLLDAGIDVLTTLNIQHLESLTGVVERITGVRPAETVPDEVVREADQIELVDMAPEALLRRLAHGDVTRDVDAAGAHHFRLENLTALREVALLWLAGRVEEARRRYRDEEPRERVVVAITGGTESAALVRAAGDLARTGAGTAPLGTAAVPDPAPAGSLLAVHVVRSDGLAGGEPPQRRETLRELVESLGGTYHTVVGDDVPAALLDFARGVEATRLVVGIGRRSRLARVFDEGVGPAVLRGSGPIAVHLIAHDVADDAGGRPGRGIRLPRLTGGVSRRRQALGAALTVLGLPALTGLLVPLRHDLQLSNLLLFYLLAVVGIALVGGWWPALLAAVSAMLLANYYFTPPVHTFTIADRTNALALAVFVLVALAVSTVVHVAALRTAQASRARAEAELLSTLAGSVLRGARGLPELLERVREAFGLTSVALLEREEAGWAVAESAGDDTTSAGEEVVPAADGLRLVLRGRPLSGGDRRVIAAFAAQAAVALRQQRLAAQAAAAAELEEANRMRTALLAAVSHDLRTPLASIKAAASSLRSPDVEWGEGDEQELLATVEDSADHLTALVDNLLDMSRIQTSSVRPALRPVGLDEVVPAALVGLDGMAELDVPETLPPVLADPGLLERVVANLVGNALRHGQGSPVRVSAGRVGGAGGAGRQDRVELRVVDRGPGVPAADRDRIFAPFQRLGDRAAGGVGLGLAVARGFTEAMGGTLTPADTPGGGLTMVVSLPVAGGDA